ncbi:MAG TPA: alpha/beta hydrolase-fold protein [Acidimicrobiia bacterium]|nr:alpha/beta hydrolase-fold protein [Acidimicrobiia bacterium]
MSETFPRFPLPEAVAEAARSMAPAYLRRRLTRARTPFIDGETVTFTYVGSPRAVRVVHFMAQFPKIPDMERFESTDLWSVTVKLPQRTRMEYQLEIEWDHETQRTIDPLNTRIAHDPFGANSVAHALGYVDPMWTSPSVDAARGDVETIEIDSKALGGKRSHSVYVPAGFPAAAPYPAVFLHDGSDLIQYAALTTSLDSLIGAGAMRPTVVVLMDPVDRNREYMALPAHGRSIVDEIVPGVTSEFQISSEPRHRVIGGASLGAVASLATAWRHPDVFGAMVLLSGTFITELGGPWHRGPELQPVVDFMHRFHSGPGLPTPMAWVACGAFEALSTDNMAFVSRLRLAGIDVSYREPLDGHHWQNWRNNLGDALRELFPAPVHH